MSQLHTPFHWYVQSKETRLVIAGFNDYWEAAEYVQKRGEGDYKVSNFADTFPTIPLNERHKLYDRK